MLKRKSEAIVSVLMPVYKPNEIWLRKVLASLQAQTLSAWKLVLCLDGYDADTLASVSVAKSMIPYEEKLHVVTGDKAGITGTLNRGLLICDTPYIARVDSDDILLPTRLQEQYSFLEASPEHVACGMQIRYIDDNDVIGREVTIGYPLKHFSILLTGAFFNNPVAHPSLFMRTKVVQSIGGYRYSQCAEDYDLVSRLAVEGLVANLPTTGIFYRVHNAQITRVTQPSRWELLSIRRTFLSQAIRRNYLCIFLSFVPFILFMLGPKAELVLRRSSSALSRLSSSTLSYLKGL